VGSRRVDRPGPRCRRMDRRRRGLGNEGALAPGAYRPPPVVHLLADRAARNRDEGKERPNSRHSRHHQRWRRTQAWRITTNRAQHIWWAIFVALCAT
jgi:hypothetical protein